ncbi:hypothetical protein CPB85DRAFT_1270033 [Mucidula mucida]|nr:hypothetical protein CPB85DRAFT_1270033 [Mucidula mucida]
MLRSFSPQLNNNKRLLTTLSSSVIDNLDLWITSPKQQSLDDTLHPERLEDLFVTLPTRDGLRKPYTAPKPHTALGYGHHFAFFNPRIPEALLGPDGTDSEFGPPEPFTRRMWAGGKMNWNNDKPLLVGHKANSTMTVASVLKKGFERGKPKVFVTKRIALTMEGSSEPSVVEDRVHVYLPISEKRQPLQGISMLRQKHDFSFTYKPSLITLFRFSAVTFNAHHIHLDKDYAVQAEGYQERLVHGPLTALMMLETVIFHRPEIKLKAFDYIATAPLIVGREHTIYGDYVDTKKISVECVSQDGIVGMTGHVELA